MKKQFIKKALSIFGLMVAGISYAQSNTENYVQSKNCLNNDCSKISETITYFDGLGRAKQIINVKTSPTGKDMVTPVTYDGFGRQTKNILPTPVATQNSLIHSGITNENTANSYYGVANAFAETEIENSPLDRVLQQANPGDAWKLSSGHTQKFKYEANAEGEVRKFVTNTSTHTVNNISNTVSALFISSDGSGYYPASVLYKNTVTDEDGNPVVQFENGQGQVVLIRRTDGSQNIDTYYVYNEYNQKAFIITPKAVKQIEQNNKMITESILNDLCYQYRYDGQDREVEKKLPGKDWEFTVYDKQDRPVLVQDGILRTVNNNFGSKGWMFTKYDQFNRVVYTGFFSNAATRQVMQNALNSMTDNASNNEKRSSAFFTLQGIEVYYDKRAFPTGSMTLLTVNYYDTYPQGAPAVPSTILGQHTLSQTLGANDDASTNNLQTASYVKNIEDNNWTKSYNYFDSKGRLISTNRMNHLGGYTKTESELDFTGAPKNTVTKHARRADEAGITVKERFVYDDQKRLVQHYHQVDSKPEELLTENSYNELSQLTNKKVGSNLQSIDYAYNIRGWLTDVNQNQMSLPDLGGKLFAYKIKYNQKDGMENPDPIQFSGKDVKSKYNGNIAEIDWRSIQSLGANPPLAPKRYGYAYDKLNRLTAGYYQNPSNPSSKENTESIDYDLNGNIKNLYRTSIVESGTTATKIDDLEYIYDSGNQVSKINDHSQNPSGYEGGGLPITYDLNGNMKSMKDKNIKTITYNFLNIPNKIEYEGGVIGIDYLYNAGGVKLQKRVPRIECGIINCTSFTDITDYIDGFQYLASINSGNGGGGAEELRSFTVQSERAMEIQAFSIDERKVLPPPTAKTPDLQFFPTAEGFYDYQKDQYIYQYKDHLGNVRISFVRNTQSQSVEITDSNDYYPFGMNHLKSGNAMFGASSYKNYKYNGKELQESGMYDYGARMYMPDLGRWGVVDPLAEKMTRHSPYNYAFNNPIRFIDPDGKQAKDITIPFGTAPKDVKAIMANLQKLTRDKLSTTKGVNGALHVFVDKFEKNGKYETGTQLIRELITDSHVVKIRAGKSNFAEAKNKESTSNGVGTDSDITFNTSGKQDIRVFSEGDKTMYETSPNFVILGHELIHAKDHFNGTLDKTDAEHSFLDLKGIRLIESHPKSEFRASGFPGFEGKDGFSENNIRKEHGLKLRASYGYFKGRIR